MSRNRNIDHTPKGSVTTPQEDIKDVPKFGWRVKFDYECKEKCDPFTKPRLQQLPSLIGLGYRYIFEIEHEVHLNMFLTYHCTNL